LLALGAAYALALAGLLVAGDSPDCCNGVICPIHQRAPAAPAKPDCHQPGGTGLGHCAMQSRSAPEHRAIGSQRYVVPQPLLVTCQAPRAFATTCKTLYLPAPPSDTESPPPRIFFV
jgi:hypothetical protein